MNRKSDTNSLSLPQPTPYASCHEHLTDLLARCSDLMAAHVARSPQGSRMRGVDRRELVERSALRSAEDVADEVRTLWEHADARLAYVSAREALTSLDLPLRRLQRAFGLSTLEVDALLLCAAPQLDARYVAEWEHVERAIVRPNVRTIIAALGRTLEQQILVRQSFSLDAPLFSGSVLIAQRRQATSESDFLDLDLDVPRRIIGELLGDAAVDDTLVAFSALKVPQDRLDDVVLPDGIRETVRELVVGHQARLEQCARWGLDEVVTHGRATILLFAGPPGTGKTMLAHAVARESGHRVFSVDVGRLVNAGHDIESNLEAVFREAKLQNAILFFDEAEQIFASRIIGNDLMQLLLTRFGLFDGVAILATNMPERFDEAMHRRIVARVDLAPPALCARAEIWRRHLPPTMPIAPDVDIERLALEHELTGGTIKNAVLIGVQRCLVRGASVVSMADLAHGARLQVRVPPSTLQHLYKAEQRLEDVVLPAELRAKVDRFVAAARVRSTVLTEWGLGRTLGTGHGLVALFAGEPGTGKSLTAEAIAHALERPVLRCDLTSVISRYVGDTAKNLGALFELARAHRAVLVFDEADTLFARRVRVTTSNDRALNGETAALLGMLDRFDGVAILTSNLGDDLDPAFARRIQLHATFNAPDVGLRTSLWRKLLGSDAPIAPDVEVERLARAFALTGAGIRTAILGAALEAASMPEGARRITREMLERTAADQLGAPTSEIASRAIGVA